MEKSIKRVEKLVHVTNSALAQMKFSLMFDDVDGNGESGRVKPLDPSLGKTFIAGDDLKLCQSEFKSEANEMLAKMESMFGSSEAARRKSKAVDKIKEINRKLNLRLEQSRLDETEQSRQKLLNLINEEKFSSGGVTSSWDSVQSKQTVREKKKSSEVPNKKTDSLLAATKSPSKDELKSKLLETQDIVNRGFQTARQLAQKVETMSRHERKERTPSTNKTTSEVNLRGPEGKTESSGSASTVKCRKCARRARRRREVEEDERNARVIEIKREEEEEEQKHRRPNRLQLQRLPSLHIRGGLQLQKVHSLEIPAGGGDAVKSNTAVSFLSHEQMKTEKMGEIIEKVRKENFCCASNNPQGNYVECFNCGKLIRVRESHVDPRKVDEILQKCNFDVFDPRIDEFVEKYGAVDNRCKTQQPDAAPSPLNNPTVDEAEVTSKKTPKQKEEHPKKSCPKIQGLSEQLLKKYKEETERLGSNHLKLENILQNLFKRIDESREVFEKCHLFKNKKSDGGKLPKLTATKPVVVSVTGDPCRNKTKCRQLNRCRSREESKKRKTLETKSNDKEKGRNQISKEGRFTMSSGGVEMLSEAGKPAEVASSELSYSTSCSSKYVFEKVVEETPLLQYGSRKTSDFREKENSSGVSALSKNKTINPPDVTEKRVAGEKAPSLSSSSSSKSRRTAQTECTMPKPKPTSQSLIETEAKTAFSKGKDPSESPSDESENNYESDFESMTNEPNENENTALEANANKLSTISEVDSELEKKVSDEQKTTLGSRRNVETDDSSKETGQRGLKKRHDDDDDDDGLFKQKTESSAVFPESKKTEAMSPKTAETCSKSTPTELVTSLKDILSALQDQFVRTESLAEKLTENMKSEGAGKPEPLFGDVMLSAWKKQELVENLRSARRDLRGEPKSPGRSEESRKVAEGEVFSMDSLSDEGGSSLGEIVVSDRRKRRASEKSGSSSISECSFLRLDSVRKSAGRRAGHSHRRESSAFKLEVNSEEVLYSEGEIPSDEVLALERFRTNSLGEVVSGKNSSASIVQ